MLDDEIYTLAYFHKDNVTNCKKIKKDCDNCKRLQKKKKKKKKKINVSSRMTLSSNINEGIREVLFFKRKDSTRTKSTKCIQATFT